MVVFQKMVYNVGSLAQGRIAGDFLSIPMVSGPGGNSTPRTTAAVLAG